MKFGLELEGSLFPLWRSYYVDYEGLKDLLEELRDNFPYMRLCQMHNLHIDNDPSEPFKFLISGVTFEFRDLDSSSPHTKHTGTLKIVSVREKEEDYQLRLQQEQLAAALEAFTANIQNGMSLQQGEAVLGEMERQMIRENGEEIEDDDDEATDTDGKGVSASVFRNVPNTARGSQKKKFEDQDILIITPQKNVLVAGDDNGSECSKTATGERDSENDDDDEIIESQFDLQAVGSVFAAGIRAEGSAPYVTPRLRQKQQAPAEHLRSSPVDEGGSTQQAQSGNANTNDFGLTRRKIPSNSSVGQQGGGVLGATQALPTRSAAAEIGVPLRKEGETKKCKKKSESSDTEHEEAAHQTIEDSDGDDDDDEEEIGGTFIFDLCSTNNGNHKALQQQLAAKVAEFRTAMALAINTNANGTDFGEGTNYFSPRILNTYRGVGKKMNGAGVAGIDQNSFARAAALNATMSGASNEFPSPVSVGPSGKKDSLVTEKNETHHQIESETINSAAAHGQSQQPKMSVLNTVLTKLGAINANAEANVNAYAYGAPSAQLGDGRKDKEDKNEAASVNASFVALVPSSHSVGDGVGPSNAASTPSQHIPIIGAQRIDLESFANALAAADMLEASFRFDKKTARLAPSGGAANTSAMLANAIGAIRDSLDATTRPSQTLEPANDNENDAGEPPAFPSPEGISSGSFAQNAVPPLQISAVHPWTRPNNRVTNPQTSSNAQSNLTEAILNTVRASSTQQPMLQSFIDPQCHAQMKTPPLIPSSSQTAAAGDAFLRNMDTGVAFCSLAPPDGCIELFHVDPTNAALLRETSTTTAVAGLNGKKKKTKKKKSKDKDTTRNARRQTEGDDLGGVKKKKGWLSSLLGGKDKEEAAPSPDEEHALLHGGVKPTVVTFNSFGNPKKTLLPSLNYYTDGVRGGDLQTTRGGRPSASSNFHDKDFTSINMAAVATDGLLTSARAVTSSVGSAPALLSETTKEKILQSNLDALAGSIRFSSQDQLYKALVQQRQQAHEEEEDCNCNPKKGTRPPSPSAGLAGTLSPATIDVEATEQLAAEAFMVNVVQKMLDVNTVGYADPQVAARLYQASVAAEEEAKKQAMKTKSVENSASRAFSLRPLKSGNSSEQSKSHLNPFDNVEMERRKSSTHVRSNSASSLRHYDNNSQSHHVEEHDDDTLGRPIALLQMQKLQKMSQRSSKGYFLNPSSSSALATRETERPQDLPTCSNEVPSALGAESKKQSDKAKVPAVNESDDDIFEPVVRKARSALIYRGGGHSAPELFIAPPSHPEVILPPVLPSHSTSEPFGSNNVPSQDDGAARSVTRPRHLSGMESFLCATSSGVAFTTDDIDVNGKGEHAVVRPLRTRSALTLGTGRGRRRSNSFLLEVRSGGFGSVAPRQPVSGNPEGGSSAFSPHSTSAAPQLKKANNVQQKRRPTFASLFPYAVTDGEAKGERDGRSDANAPQAPASYSDNRAALAAVTAAGHPHRHLRTRSLILFGDGAGSHPAQSHQHSQPQSHNTTATGFDHAAANAPFGSSSYDNVGTLNTTSGTAVATHSSLENTRPPFSVYGETRGSGESQMAPLSVPKSRTVTTLLASRDQSMKRLQRIQQLQDLYSIRLTMHIYVNAKHFGFAGAGGTKDDGDSDADNHLILSHSSGKGVSYCNPAIAHALYAYQRSVSATVAAALQIEIEKASSFYLSQTHILCRSALLCIDGVKMWETLTAREREQLRTVYRQTYLTFRILQQFCDLNILAVGKFLKKVDKNLLQNSLENYRGAIENLNFRMGHNSRIVMVQKLMVHKLAEHAMNGSIKKAFNFLETTRDENSDFASTGGSSGVRLGKSKGGTLLSLAFFAGLVLTMAAMIILILIATGATSKDLFWSDAFSKRHAEYLILVPAIFAIPQFLFSINVMIYEHFGINFAFMFELDPIFHFTGAELMRDSLIYIFAWEVCVYVFLRNNYHHLNCAAGQDLLVDDDNREPFVAVLWAIFPIFIAIWLGIAAYNRFISVERRSFWSAEVFWRIVTTPYYPVRFPDFFVLNYLTSMTTVLFEVEWYWCTFSSDPISACTDGRSMSLCFLNSLPNIWRMVQSIKRYLAQPKATRKAFPNLVNAGKYGTGVIQPFVWTAWSIARFYKADPPVLTAMYVLAFASQVITQSYKYTWDVVVDAGIFIDYGQNGYEWRKERVYKAWWPYISFMFVDFVLRWRWLVTYYVQLKYRPRWFFAMWSIVELVRRSWWSAFRVENEHVNNTEHYRATKLAPIPVKNIHAWDTFASDASPEQFLSKKKRDQFSKEFPQIKGINLSSVTRFFAMLPEEEKLEILTTSPLCSGYIPESADFDFDDEDEFNVSQKGSPAANEEDASKKVCPVNEAAAVALEATLHENRIGIDTKYIVGDDPNGKPDTPRPPRRQISKFKGKLGEGKSKFFSELPEEHKVIVIVNYLGSETMSAFEKRIQKEAEAKSRREKEILASGGKVHVADEKKTSGSLSEKAETTVVKRPSKK